jgi:hypothetical protein
VKYAFIKAHCYEYKVRTLCRVIGVHRSGFYAWCRQPLCRRAIRDVRQTNLIKQFWIESGGIYGYRKIHDDMKEVGEICGKHRVYRLMRSAKLRSQTGYGIRETPAETQSRETVGLRSESTRAAIRCRSPECSLGHGHHVQCAQKAHAWNVNGSQKEGTKRSNARSSLRKSESRSGGDLSHTDRVTKPVENGT